MEEIESVLERIGLSKNEVKVYLVLLKIGSATAGEITQKSGVHRRNVYDALERLIEKGLVSFIIQNNKKYFEIATPDRLIVMLKEREEDIRDKEKLIHSILPMLSSIRDTTKGKSEAKVFRGKEGIKSILEDALKTFEREEVKEFFSFGATGTLHKIIHPYFSIFTKRRVKLGVTYKIAYTELAKERAKEFAKTPLTIVKMVPKAFSSPCVFWIYGNKLIIALLSKELIAIMIENEEIVSGFKKYFRLLWRTARPLR